MCLAIPGQVLELVDDPHRLAKVDVAEALATRRALEQLGEAYEQELADLEVSAT